MALALIVTCAYNVLANRHRFPQLLLPEYRAIEPMFDFEALRQEAREQDGVVVRRPDSIEIRGYDVLLVGDSQLLWYPVLTDDVILSRECSEVHVKRLRKALSEKSHYQLIVLWSGSAHMVLPDECPDMDVYLSATKELLALAQAHSDEVLLFSPMPLVVTDEALRANDSSVRCGTAARELEAYLFAQLPDMVTYVNAVELHAQASSVGLIMSDTFHLSGRGHMAVDRLRAHTREHDPKRFLHLTGFDLADWLTPEELADQVHRADAREEPRPAQVPAGS